MSWGLSKCSASEMYVQGVYCCPCIAISSTPVANQPWSNVAQVAYIPCGWFYTKCVILRLRAWGCGLSESMVPGTSNGCSESWMQRYFGLRKTWNSWLQLLIRCIFDMWGTASLWYGHLTPNVIVTVLSDMMWIEGFSLGPSSCFFGNTKKIYCHHLSIDRLQISVSSSSHWLLVFEPVVPYKYK